MISIFCYCFCLHFHRVRSPDVRSSPPPNPANVMSKNNNNSTSTSDIVKPLQQLSVMDNTKTNNTKTKNTKTNTKTRTDINTSDKALYAKGLTIPSSQQSKSANGKGVKSSRRLSQEQLDLLTARQRKKLREAQNAAFLEHPYALKLEQKKCKLNSLLNSIYDLANNDLLICDFDTGLNDYSKNLKFADELDEMSKVLIGLSKDCTDKANVIRERIDQAKEDKRLIQDVVFLQEIVKESEKCDDICLVRPDQNYVPKEYVHTSEFRVKRERPVHPLTLYVDTTDSEDENEAPKKKKEEDRTPQR